MEPKICVISRFRREVAEICGLMGYYVASDGNFILMFRDNLSGLSLGSETALLRFFTPPTLFLVYTPFGATGFLLDS